MIYATEMGIGRALSAALSKKSAALKPLPTYDEVVEKGKAKEAQRKKPRSSWIDRFERANKIGRYARTVGLADFAGEQEQHGTEHTDDPVQDPGG
jgi:hypothetical protein